MKKYETPEVLELTLANEDILALSSLKMKGDGKEEDASFGEFHYFN